MGFLKWLLWTTCAVGLGIYLATGSISGRTPLEHLQRAWKRHVQPSSVDRLKDGIQDLYDDAKGAVTGTAETQPRERISADDRAEVNRIIAQKK